MASSPTRLAVNPLDARLCESRKACFRTKNEALDIAEKMMELRRVHPGCHLTPYQCCNCGRWHIYNRVIVDLRRRRPDGTRR